MKIGSVIKKARKEKRRILSLEESMSILKSYGIPIVKQGFSRDENELKTVAKKIGFPVVIKIDSVDVTHKTDAGAIYKNIESENDLIKKYHAMMKNFKSKHPRAKLRSVVVQQMVSDSLEVIVGGKKDPQFGQVLLFGSGGIFVESEEDTSFRVVPITGKDAEDMIKETRVYKILSSSRGRKYDLRSVVECITRVSRLLNENQEIEEMDINPLFVGTKGSTAVDARIILSG